MDVSTRWQYYVLCEGFRDPYYQVAFDPKERAFHALTSKMHTEWETDLNELEFRIVHFVKEHMDPDEVQTLIEAIEARRQRLPLTAESRRRKYRSMLQTLQLLRDNSYARVERPEGNRTIPHYNWK